MNCIFVFDELAKYNKFVYAHYSSTLNGFYIYKLSDDVQKRIKEKYKSMPKIVIGKITMISYNNKDIQGDFEDWLDVDMDLIHSSEC